MINQMTQLGQVGLIRLCQFGRAGLLIFQVIFSRPTLRALYDIITQIYAQGVQSLIIILISSLFIGMVLALQGYHTLNKFGASQELGPLIALSVLRELGPVVTALLFAGRAGSSVTAEIALMKATDQLSSMEMMAVNPLKRIIAPRFWGGFISLPLLTIIFNTMAIYGAYLIGVAWLGVESGIFWSNMQSAVNFHTDVVNGVIKSLVFGFIIIWIAVFQGYFSTSTSEGIASATTRTVVKGSLAVLGLDFILTAMMIGEW